MSNAIILAAGKSSQFFKPLYDRPKGLFVYQSESLIERQIRQLKEAGIKDITVVVGYEKEQYFFLIEKYSVKIVINENYALTGSLISLLKVLNSSYADDVFVCCADHWYKNNPFLNFTQNLHSVRLVSYIDEASSEFVIDQSPDGKLYNLRSGAKSGLSMFGFAYFRPEFIRKFCELFEEEKNWLGVASLHWEQFWGRFAAELPLYGLTSSIQFLEFDSLADLQKKDPKVLDNLSSCITKKICALLNCELSDIREIQPLNRGLTNVSFSFILNKNKYVYRYPGYSSTTMVNRYAEVVAQNTAIKLGIDNSVISIGDDGHKLSNYIETTAHFEYNNEEHINFCIQALKNFHKNAPHINYEINMLAEGDRLLKIASNTKGALATKYSSIRNMLERLWHHTELDGWEKVLCHNDVYAVNWLVSQKQLHLIDWEYAAMNDPINDLATFIVRDSLNEALIKHILKIYFEHTPTVYELRHCYAIFAMCSWYWFCWSLFKDTLGEDGSFMLSSYQGLLKYTPMALAMYETNEIFNSVENTFKHTSPTDTKTNTLETSV